MVPQDSDNNRQVWAGIEQAVRKLAQKEGDLYVITGPAFLGSDLRKVGKVLVPSHLYKVVYSPRQRAGAAYFVENKADVQYVTMNVAQLEAKIGIDLLPSLSARQKETMLRLPSAKPRKDKR
jgi:endonuclease G